MRQLAFDLLEQTATPTSETQTMFWTAPDPATTVWSTEPSCWKWTHTHTHTSVIKCHVFFPSTYFQSSVCVLTVFAYELCAFISICVYMYVSYPQGPDVHEASHSSRCQGQTIRTESQCSYWSDVAL